ncbi:hypothetical protein [Aeromonas enteropelogenes]
MATTGCELLLFGIFLLIHFWAKYNKLLYRLMRKRAAQQDK